MIKRDLARRAFASCIDLPAFEFNHAATCALTERVVMLAPRFAILMIILRNLSDGHALFRATQVRRCVLLEV
jgi:hypothetical protein